MRHSTSRLRASAIAGLSLALTSFMACSAKQEPSHGQLMVALSTDMSVPKDVTHIRVKIKLGAEVRYEYDFQIAPDGEFHIPGTLAVVEGSTTNPVVGVEVVGIRTLASGSTQARTFSKIVTTIPRERIALVRVPVQWLCDNTALDDGTGEYLSSCSLVDGQESACFAGTCLPVLADEGTFPTFDPTQVFGGGPAPSAPGARCFDTLACFDAGQDLAQTALSTSCTFSVPDDGATLNVALKMPPGSDGICHTDLTQPCYVPLDQDDTWGWKLQPGSGGMRTIALPPGACSKLTAGTAQAVRVTTTCATKTAEYATCGAWSDITTVLGTTDGTDAGSKADAGSQGGTGGADAGAGAGASGVDAGKGGAGAGGLDSGTGAGGASDAGTGVDAGPPPPPPCVGPVVFPDPGLDSMVRLLLGISSGPIDGAQAATLTSLSLLSPIASDLTGAECLVGLTSFAMDASTVTSLAPLQGLTELQDISLSGQPGDGGASAPDGGPPSLSLAPLQNLTKLTSLQIHLPSVDLAPLATLSNLVQLDVSSTALYGSSPLASLASMASLTTLNLSMTSITDVLAPLAGLPKLASLDVSHNSVSDLTPLAGILTLSTLHVDYTLLLDATPITSLTNLQVLTSANTGVISLTGFDQLKQLTTLDLSSTQLADITPLGGLINLNTLNLSFTPLTDISSLSGLTNLQTLALAGLALTAPMPLAPLTNLINLDFLDLSAGYNTYDLTPLQGNTGLGAGDTVNLGNYCNDPTISLLQSNYVTVNYSNSC